MSEIESGIGLDIIIWLQEHSNALLDLLALAIHYVGGTPLWIGVVLVFYWSIDKQEGRRMFFGLLLTLLAFTVLKELLQFPRPLQAFPDKVDTPVEQVGYGLPSGHVSLAMFMSGYLAVVYRKWWLWGLAVIYPLLTGWARMVLAVHYPQDVLAGLGLGILLIWLFVRYRARVTRQIDRIALRQQFIVVAVVSVLLLGIFWEVENGLASTGLFAGSWLGFHMEQRKLCYEDVRLKWQGLLRIGAGGLLLLLIFGLMRWSVQALAPQSIFYLLRYAIAGWIAGFGWPWLGVQYGLFTRSTGYHHTG